MNEEQEDELFERTKMGWQFRDLYIEEDHEVAYEKKKKEGKTSLLSGN